MQVGVGIGVDPGIVGEEVLHGVETMIDRHRVDGVAEMPLAGEVGLIAVLLEELGDGRRLRTKFVGVAGRDHDRERGAYRQAAGHERGAAGGATRLPVPFGEGRALGGEPVEVRGRGVAGLATAIDAEVTPAGVVGHEHDSQQVKRGQTTPKHGQKCNKSVYLGLNVRYCSVSG
jgi:hypothetical protein